MFSFYVAIWSCLLWIAPVSLYGFHIWFRLYLIRGAGEQRWIANTCSQLCFSGCCRASGCLWGLQSGSEPDTWGYKWARFWIQWRIARNCISGGKEKCFLSPWKLSWCELKKKHFHKKVLFIEYVQISEHPSKVTEFSKLWNNRDESAQGWIHLQGGPRGKYEVNTVLFNPEFPKPNTFLPWIFFPQWTDWHWHWQSKSMLPSSMANISCGVTCLSLWY